MGKGGGKRELQEEKTLLSELGKLFHITRANAREQRIKQQVSKTASANNAAKETSDSPQRERNSKQEKKQKLKQQTRSKKSRKSTRGGTVWVVLKGGFAQVPTEANSAVISHNKNFRGRLSERRRVEALEAAEQYVQTAWQQAQEAGLLVKDGSAPSGEEGLQYLREQYAVAAAMLKREAVGSQLKQIVDQTIPSGFVNSTASSPSSTTTGVEATTTTTVCDKDKWAEIIARENVILNRFADVSAVKDDGELVHHEAAQIGSKYYFNTFEPLAPENMGSADITTAGHAGSNSDALLGEKGRDILPSKCIVRIRGSGKQKHTSIICTTKAVNYFKSNFMQIIRKELGNSKLPRGEETVEGKQQQQQHPPQRGNNAPSENNASGSSKNVGKKRQK
ncbi:uncharacterized protein TM35_000391820 [Trypanosoma theileri]|uniref:Uncharacterized protein n=1 Tax=Trypanosoma theileri TaxID=67003 RepID=A0A1X0NKG5_9TRYP|nr:uncharacterized protein TM35_000391820 [Trypanosoma theileri]ORC85008.1 hypothetical protein TM35_000391820 [Trypanosoma theileri]